MLRAIPTTYRKTRFRSSLEAEWAQFFDIRKIVWNYEPVGVQLDDGTQYLPDFYLPEIATWFEVKGPHDQRIEKTHALAAEVGPCTDDACTCYGEHELVIIGRAPIHGSAVWELGNPYAYDDVATLDRCKHCGKYWWRRELGAYGCRAHRRYEGGDDDLSSPVIHSADIAGRFEATADFPRLSTRATPRRREVQPTP